MILWLLLLFVVVISFLLALRSMRDYQEIPSQSQYGLFLIRNPKALNTRILNNLYEDFLKRNLILSFERLFKGHQSTLLIYGPKELANLYDMLDLLELEDYTIVNINHISVWEIGIKGRVEDGVFKNMPQLNESEHFWWQVVLSRSMRPEIRVILLSDDIQRRKLLTDELQNLAPDKLFTLPKAFSNEDLLNFYQKRSYKRDNKNPNLSPEKLLNLIAI